MKKIEALSKRQMKILTWWTRPELVDKYDGIIADGSIRSGKTLSMSLSFVFWAMSTFNGESFGLCGKTIETFRRNVLKDLKPHLKAHGFKVQEFRKENLITISRGEVSNSFYIFGGKDERSQDLVQGVTLAGVFFDEVALMPESFVNQATGRCSVKGSKFYFNCNPGSPTHWFKKNWLDDPEKHQLHIHFTLEDNPSLSERTKERYYNMYTGVFKRRFIDGEWCVAEGLIYDGFDPENDALESVPEELAGERYVSVDYGTSNPCVFLLWEKGKSGIWYLTEEFYYSGRDERKQKTDQEYVEEFARFLNGRLIKAVIVDPSAASFIVALKQAGYKVRKARNDVLDGIRFTATKLKQGKAKILKKCKHTLEEFGVYCWDDRKQEDTPIKENDHCMDALRYFVFTILKKRRVQATIRGGLG